MAFPTTLLVYGPLENVYYYPYNIDIQTFITTWHAQELLIFAFPGAKHTIPSYGCYIAL